MATKNLLENHNGGASSTIWDVTSLYLGKLRRKSIYISTVMQYTNKTSEIYVLFIIFYVGT